MTRINLLDWRRDRRELRRKQFLAMIGAAIAMSALIVGLGYFGVGSALGNQNDRNAYLQQQIAEMDQKIKEIQELEKVRSNLLSRMRVIEELQASRSATVHFFDEIVNTLPEGVNLTLVKQNGANVTIEGVAESNGRVSTYMKNLDASPWFKEPKLVVIKTSEKNNQRKSDFTLQVTNLTKGDTASEQSNGEIIE